MDRAEYEKLVTYVKDGELDQSLLAATLAYSPEFITRYGTLSDSEFITQLYLNSYGRAPSLAELSEALAPLADLTMQRADFATALADSAEHLVVGNGHLSANNTNVFLNPAEFERSLDRADVEATVRGLVDVAYDRGPTRHELETLADRLIDGNDNPEDIVALLLSTDGDLHGPPRQHLPLRRQ